MRVLVEVPHRLVAGSAATTTEQVLFALPLEGGFEVFGEPLGVVGDLDPYDPSFFVGDVPVDRSSLSSEEDRSGDSSGAAEVEDPPF